MKIFRAVPIIGVFCVYLVQHNGEIQSKRHTTGQAALPTPCSDHIQTVSGLHQYIQNFVTVGGYPN